MVRNGDANLVQIEHNDEERKVFFDDVINPINTGGTVPCLKPSKVCCSEISDEFTSSS